VNKNKVRYSFDPQGNFVIDNYNYASVFASFLPAIAGKKGIPLWAFYINRAQAIATFGLQDKNHSILEFLPANKTFSAVFEKGFRTFVKIDKRVNYEPFRPENVSSQVQQRLIINSGYICIEEESRGIGLKFKITYFTLPQEPLGALVRILEIENIARVAREVEVLDGLGEIAPFGLEDIYYKNLSRTVEAWVHTQLENKYCLFRLLTSLKDSAQVDYIKGANFYLSYYFSSGRQKFMKYIVDPQFVFLRDSTRQQPYNFFQPSFSYPRNQITSGLMPAAMGYESFLLGAKERVSIISLLGAFEHSYLWKGLLRKTARSDFIPAKFELNSQIIKEIKDTAFVSSNKGQFSDYISASFLDNILRGGWPVSFKYKDKESVLYLFSRKHGDLERDYNRFYVLASYYSSGEGNFRDINQNRRCDLFFNPALGRANIYFFFNLQRLDGYNPLVVKGYSFRLDYTKKRKKLANFINHKQLSLMGEVFHREFSLPEIVNFVYRHRIEVKDWEGLVGFIVNETERIPAAEFGEGFWTDHWFYNLDLVENYLLFFPDKQNELLNEKVYTFYDDEVGIQPRRLRYKEDKRGGLYQDNFLFFSSSKKDLIERRPFRQNAVRNKQGKGEIAFVDLWTKFLVLLVNKTASLDAEGWGIEMEAGKPGWCDALNGLPRLFGSSLSETLELKRMALMLKKFIKEALISEIIVPKEIKDFFSKLKKLISEHKKRGFRDSYRFWDASNLLKEKYRKEVFWGLSGKKSTVSLGSLDEFCTDVIDKIDYGLTSLKKKYKLLPTYFISEKTQRCRGSQRVCFSLRALPLFLESLVHFLKICSPEEARRVYQEVKNSPLFDRKLKMYRLNASLQREPLTIGRIRVFNPGWLENESIWLHMEYKYLLELLKVGLYQEFYREFYQAGICFQKPAVYGRSVVENSSFIVSSAYIDKSIWGKGFVARLSGSTAELLNIFMIIALGRQPFFTEGGKLYLKFSPLLEKNLFSTKRRQAEIYLGEERKEFILTANTFCFKIFNSTLICYHNPQRKNTFSANTVIDKIEISYKDKTKRVLRGNIIPEPDSLRIRNREALLIDIFIK